MKCKMLISFLVLGGGVFASLAEPVVGPGAFVVKTATDKSYVGAPLVVPEAAASTNWPGAFYPPGGKGVYAVVWRNVSLADIATFSAHISASGKQLALTETYQTITNVDGSVQCQFQADGSPMYGVVVTFRQSGANVEARIDMSRLSYRSTTQPYGGDFRMFGNEISFVESVVRTSSDACSLSDLSCVLNEGVTVPPIAPTEIRLVNTDEAEVNPITLTYGPCLTNVAVTVARHLRLEDFVGMDAEMSFADLNGGAWSPVGGHRRTNINDYVEINLVTNIGLRRLAGIVRLEQKGPDVVARITWAGHSYDGGSLDDPIGPGYKGTELGVTDKANTSKLAFRNIRLEFCPKRVITRVFDPCLMRSYVKLWPAATLTELSPLGALMGGQVTGKKWVGCRAYFPLEKNSGVSYLYEWQRTAEKVEICEVLLRDDGHDVWGRVESMRYGWGTAGKIDARGTNLREITNVVDGVSTKESYECQALCSLTATQIARNRHVVMMDAGFRPGFSPIFLDNVKLTLAPAADDEADLDYVVTGNGAVGISGRVLLNADLSDGIGLEVDAGAVVISADRTVRWPVKVAQGAALEFCLANGIRPKLVAQTLSFDQGSQVVLSGSATDIPAEGQTFKLVTGCALSSDVLTRVTLQTAGEFAARYKAALSVDASGDLVVTAVPKKGLMIIFR